VLDLIHGFASVRRLERDCLAVLGLTPLPGSARRCDSPKIANF
jgi:hypothetical protein